MVRLLLACLLALAAVAQGSEADGGTRITAADIAAERPATLLELLRQKVGLDVNNSSITMRGVRGVAIFVDGFSSSATELELLRPEQVELVEIFRGAASSRFGAEAMGGAIAVTTRGSHRLHGSLSQGADARGGRFSRATAAGDTGALLWSLQAEDRTSHGYRAVPDSPLPYQITVDAERGSKRLLDGKIGWRSADFETSLNLKQSQGWSYFGRPAWSADWQIDNARLQWTWRLDSTLALEGGLGEERYHNAGTRDRGTDTGSFGLSPSNRLVSRYRQREGTLALVRQNNAAEYRAGINVVELTEHYRNADYASGEILRQADSDIRKEALFASAKLPLGPGRLELGLRRDLQRYLGSRILDAGPPVAVSSGGGGVKSATSPRLAVNWPLAEQLQGQASLGTGFLPPQATQLYNGYRSSGNVQLANPGLRPERSLTLDWGLAGSRPGGNWSLTFFLTRWQDKISTRILSAASPTVSQAQNVGEVGARGLEWQWTGRLATGWSLSANYTFNRTRVLQDEAAPQLVGKELPDMPRHKANLALSYEGAQGLLLRARLRAVSGAFTDDANTLSDSRGYRWRKAGYGVLDLSATWRQPAWDFTLALDNVFDRDYVTGLFWRGEPRLLRSELSWRF
ncbi:MAG: TonB-dependent receptor [Pseudomonadota bacterium]